MASQHLLTLSRFWLLGMYETIRTINKSAGEQAPAALREVYRTMHVVRIALAKNQIATVKGVPMSGLKLEASGDGPATIIDYNAAQANYRPITLFNPSTGSIAWKVVSMEGRTHLEMTRRQFSDSILALAD